MVSIRKVGGIHFIKAGRLNVSFSMSRKLVKPSNPDMLDDIVNRLEDAIAAPLSPIYSIGALLVFICWTLALVQVPMDSWTTIADYLYFNRGFLESTY